MFSQYFILLFVYTHCTQTRNKNVLEKTGRRRHWCRANDAMWAALLPKRILVKSPGLENRGDYLWDKMHYKILLTGLWSKQAYMAKIWSILFWLLSPPPVLNSDLYLCKVGALFDIRNTTPPRPLALVEGWALDMLTSVVWGRFKFIFMPIAPSIGAIF